MTNKERRQIVAELLADNKSAYAIHLKTGLSFAEVSNYIREDEEFNQRRNKTLWEQKEKDRQGKQIA